MPLVEFSAQLEFFLLQETKTTPKIIRSIPSICLGVKTSLNTKQEEITVKMDPELIMTENLEA